jgi:hypothetical protein
MNRRQNAHRATASVTLQNIDSKDASHQLSPRMVRSPLRHGFRRNSGDASSIEPVTFIVVSYCPGTAGESTNMLKLFPVYVRMVLADAGCALEATIPAVTTVAKNCPVRILFAPSGRR